MLSMYSHHVRALLCEVWNELYTNNKVLVHENHATDEACVVF